MHTHIQRQYQNDAQGSQANSHQWYVLPQLKAQLDTLCISHTMAWLLGAAIYIHFPHFLISYPFLIPYALHEPHPPETT